MYYQIVDARSATYEVVNLVAAMEQLTITTLRNVIGGLTLDKTLTSREDINAKMRAGLDEVTEGWGVRVTRVELKDIIPPREVQQAMEKQMQAEREKRAAILRADGQKQAAILNAEGQKQAAILTAEGKRQALILQAEGDAQALVTVQQAQAKAIDVVFAQLTASRATPKSSSICTFRRCPRSRMEPPTSSSSSRPNSRTSPAWEPRSRPRRKTVRRLRRFRRRSATE